MRLSLGVNDGTVQAEEHLTRNDPNINQIMKNPIQLHWAPWLLLINVALAVLAGGCATPTGHSFNKDFGETLPTQPNYYIQDEDDHHFTITVNQGVPSTGAERLSDVKKAASTVAKAESQRLGWEKWQLDYIQERDQGWMHVVIADVKHIPYVAPTFPQSNSNPNSNP